MKYITTITLFLLPITLFAATEIPKYKPLVGLPGLDAGSMDFNTYINALYALSISIAALLAVIKVIIAGVKWMTTDIVTSKGEAKEDIKGALMGLLVVLGAVIILTTINSSLTKADLQLNKITPAPYSAGTASNNAPSAFNNIPAGAKLMPFGGNGISSLGANPTEDDFRDLCENIKPEDCPDGWFSWAKKKAGYPESACYEGIYDPNSNSCLVTADKLKLSEFKCESTGSLDEPGNIIYTCEEAKAACINGKGKWEISDTGHTVNCTYK